VRVDATTLEDRSMTGTTTSRPPRIRPTETVKKTAAEPIASASVGGISNSVRNSPTNPESDPAA